MGRQVIETILGAVVLVVAAIFVMISYKSGNIANSSGYVVKAKFNEIGSLSIGSDIRVGGIKIGSVSNQYLDPENYRAVLEFNIDNKIKLPKDSSAAIASDGLLGGKYINIVPGASDAFLASGDIIEYTQDAVNIENLIGKFAFGGVNEENNKPNDTNNTGNGNEPEKEHNDSVPSLDPGL